jgi:hypothetical protein
MAIPDEPEIQLMLDRAADEAVSHYIATVHAEERQLARLMTKMDCLIIPVTVIVIAVLVWTRFALGPEVGTLTVPSGYAVLRVFIGRRIS